MRHLIVGTAGHVDHGKTALIRALTGIDTDRLQEEKERGISIELGFAYLDLPSGRRVGIVDVPGHERFIKNMLAGVGGIDLVLLVIAADEGVMPQTREHLEIIQLLQVPKGIVVLTKVDLVDPEWLELVREEVANYLRDTPFHTAPVVCVSSVTGEGLAKLLQVMDELAAGFQENNEHGVTRVPIDRVFSVTGFGTVATGTLIEGTLQVGDTVVILPKGLKARVRTLQVHKQKVKRVGSGQRVAVNLSGVDMDDVTRGDVLAFPGAFQPTKRLDVRLELLPEAPRPLKNRARVRFYLGAAEILGRAILFGCDELNPGEQAYAQLLLEQSTVAAKKDRFVLRSYSPMRTIGGGTVINPYATRHKRSREETLTELATLERGTPEELVFQLLSNRKDMLTLREIADATGLETQVTQEALDGLIAVGRVEDLDGEGQHGFITAQCFNEWWQRVLNSLKEYHQAFPLREGYPKEELRSKRFSGIAGSVFQTFLSALSKRGLVEVLDKSVRLPGAGELPPALQGRLERIENAFAGKGMQPDPFAEVLAVEGIVPSEGLEYLHYLLRNGRLVKISEELYFHPSAVAEAKKLIAAMIREHGGITLGEARDGLKTSRKFALPLLEYLDQTRFTRRIGDKRTLVKE